MGGNVIALNKKTLTETRAERIDLTEISRKLFIIKSRELFSFINKECSSWADEVLDLEVFNGSTSYVMDLSITDEDIIKYKPTVGDIDIMVPVEHKELLWNYLDSIEGVEVIHGVEYAGCNKPTISSIGNQINTVFIFSINNIKIPVQVDFELVEFIDGHPSEWAKFSHSSSFDDAKLNIKAVHHKFLIRSLVGGASYRDDIIISTPKSTPDNITLTKSKDHLYPRMLKFSVDRGIRVAYEPLLLGNESIIMENKKVFRPLSTAESTFVTDIEEIFKLSFQQAECSKQDVELFNSFNGVIKLMKTHFNAQQIKDTTERYIELLWGFDSQRGQELERSDPSSDYDIKKTGYEYYIKELSLVDVRDKYINEYYSTYRD